MLKFLLKHSLRYIPNHCLCWRLVLNSLCEVVRTYFNWNYNLWIPLGALCNRSHCHSFVVVQAISHFFLLSNNLETTWYFLSRCPGASHQRVALERRKTSKTQTETENENGTTIIDLPGTSPPETDCSGTGTAPAERTLTSASLPVWTEEPGLDNPAFEESTIADSMC